MNSQFCFYPYWSFVPSSNYIPVFIPVFQFNTFEDPLLIEQHFFNQNQKEQILCNEKNDGQNERQINFHEKKQADKRKSHKKCKQDRNYSYRYQDKDRNICSNILKGFIGKMRQDRGFQIICQNMMKRAKFNFQFDEFLEFVDQKFDRTNTYISPTYMKRVLKSQGPIEMKRFLRLLTSKYLKEQFILVLLSSQRIQKNSKILQMEKARQLWDQIYGNEQEIEKRKKQQLN